MQGGCVTMAKVDWYKTIEPRRSAEVSLTPGGLAGADDPLDSPPAAGSEESWLGLQAKRLRELGAQAAAKLESARGAAKQRLERALGELGRAARGGAKIARDLAMPPAVKEFSTLSEWFNKLTLASAAAQGIGLLLLLWGAKEFLSSPGGRAAVASRFGRF